MSGKGNDKKARLAEALRANLRRRREQARQRNASASKMERPEKEGCGNEDARVIVVNPPQIPEKGQD